MQFTKELVNELADKLLIGLTDEENKMVLNEFKIIDRNIDLINNIPNIKDVEPMTHCLDEYIEELRSDIIKESVPTKDILKNSDDTKDNEIKVIKVVE